MADGLFSSLVGLAIMVVLLPVPKKVAGLMSSVQKEKMRAVGTASGMLPGKLIST